jgi:hypothetical protein
MLPAQACRPEPKRQVVQAGVELAERLTGAGTVLRQVQPHLAGCVVEPDLDPAVLFAVLLRHLFEAEEF